MKKMIYRAACMVFTMAAISSCSLDEYNPKEVTGDETLATFDGLYGMQAKCYEPVYGQLYTVFDFMSMAECGTDLWWTANNKTHTKELFYYESLVPFANKGWDKAFTQMYSALGNCNAIINRAEKVTDGDSKALTTLVAEARFLRGYYHLLLTTYYGPITLVLQESGINPVLSPKRNTLSEIYTSIIDDLTYAVENLPKTPFENNRARATKKSAMGMLCRAYIQGAGQGLTANGQSYWELAKKTAEEFIADTEAGGGTYGGYLYGDVADMWADTNNRTNKEALFVAAGIDACDDSNLYWYANPSNNKLFTYTYWNQTKLSDISGIKSDKQNYYYGRTNNNVMAPSKYLMDCFDASWDKRWENSFQTAFGRYTFVDWAYPTYEGGILTLTDALCSKYDIDPAMVGQKIYPYVNCGLTSYSQGGNQYQARVWPKGDYSGDMSKLETPKKAYVIEYPLPVDENRIFLYMYPKKGNENFDKTGRVYASVCIDDLFVADGSAYVANQDEMTALKDKTSNIWQAFPSLNKFQWSYDGVFMGSNLQIKNGDIFVMRMAEVYLIAAEASQHLGDGATAAKYLNKLRARAARSGVSTSAYNLSNATEDDIFDEYARELCGEFSRWALLQRHQAFAARLAKYNKRAAAAYKDYCIWRPISQTFLQQIDNAEEYGDNGYGTTAKSGLEGYLE